LSPLAVLMKLLTMAMGAVLQGEKLSYCEVSGNPVEVGAACTANPNCKAFTTTGGSGGYLKTAAGPATYTEGSTTYVKG